ncbi:MAG: ATP-dependent RecD-like DNA helicase [Oscillospiraceae bacterium]|nr:ATP-dependent RecD-like DNA helicase [Oscillospiraceae bacterium]
MSDNTIYIEGTVDEVVFCNEENGYIVLYLDCDGDLETVTGELGVIEEGEELKLGGKFVDHPRFGRQFRAATCERMLPATETAILKYLSSGAIKGIGPSLAKRIVDEFGTDALEIIEKEPTKLAAVKGVSLSRASEIHEEFMRIHGARALMIFFAGFGIAPSFAMKAWKVWGQFAEGVIKNDPFRLCDENIGLDFAAADRIADSLSMDKECPERLTAGARCVLEDDACNGNTCMLREQFIYEAADFLGVPSDKVSAHLDECLENETLSEFIKETDGKKQSYIALTEYFRAEKEIAERLLFMSSSFADNKTDYSKYIDIEETTKSIKYAQNQRKAISDALSRGFLILTGGPGTGKTTTLKAIISMFEQRGLKVMITAPTGRAAKRISDLTGYPAKTIHRMLEVVFDNGGTMKFRHGKKDPLSCDVMIVDEMSMVDTLLFESLLNAMKLSCRLIMVGDSDQLPSVGAGNVLGDMVESGVLPTVHLNEIFRQAKQSLIITNAHDIVSGREPELMRSDGDFFFIQRLDNAQCAQTVVELVTKRLPKAYGYSPVDDIQVLCPSRKGITGMTELNRALQEQINPPQKQLSEIKGPLYTFRDGDKVMQIKNNYDIEWERDGEKGTGIYNGDIGTIVRYVRSEGYILINFEGRQTRYPVGALNQLELAYAITVHKSQGSEFNAVIIPLLGSSDMLYYRNLLYTAVTRAKKLLIIVGSKNIVKRMVDNAQRTCRNTTLRERLLSAEEKASPFA